MFQYVWVTIVDDQKYIYVIKEKDHKTAAKKNKECLKRRDEVQNHFLDVSIHAGNYNFMQDDSYFDDAIKCSSIDEFLNYAKQAKYSN